MAGITVIGSPDFILGFRLAGIRNVYPEKTNIEQRITQVLTEGHASILILHDEDFTRLPQAMKRKLRESRKPIVISVGSREEDDLRTKIKRVIGVDLYNK
jgi:V/A-type H+/Na+-transporting ATPase subunit F